MDAEDQAREVVAYAQPRDRPSPLALVVFCRRGRGRDVRNASSTLRVTAPTENGRLLLRVAFPAPNSDAPAIVRAVDFREERVTLEYDGTNAEGVAAAAACIEGYMTHRDSHDVMLFTLHQNGDLGSHPLARWSLSFEEERRNQTAPRLQILQQILRSLLVR